MRRVLACLVVCGCASAADLAEQPAWKVEGEPYSFGEAWAAAPTRDRVNLIGALVTLGAAVALVLAR